MIVAIAVVWGLCVGALVGAWIAEEHTLVIVFNVPVVVGAVALGALLSGGGDD
jgi:hypothetical protein